MSSVEVITISKLANYEPRTWHDRIYKMGPDNKLIPKVGPNGQPVLNPYTGHQEFETLEEGTRFYAKYMNHIEQGIANAHGAILIIDKDLKKMMALMELDGRAPNNNGTFADIFEDTEASANFERLSLQTDMTADVAAGSTVIPVADASGFVGMTYVTVMDADSYEQVRVREVDVAGKRLTVDALMGTYSKGAKVGRSTAGIDAVAQQLVVAPFVSYSVSLVEVV